MPASSVHLPVSPTLNTNHKHEDEEEVHSLANGHESLKLVLEVVLKSHVEVEGVAAVSKANAYERTAALKGNEEESHVFRREFTSQHQPNPPQQSSPTAVILDTQHEVPAGVTDCFHCDPRVLLHWSLGEQLPCRRERGGGAVRNTVTNPWGLHQNRAQRKKIGFN